MLTDVFLGKRTLPSLKPLELKDLGRKAAAETYLERRTRKYFSSNFSQEEFHGDYYKRQQQPAEKRCGKAVDRSPGKWPHHLISSLAAFPARREERLLMKVNSKEEASSKLIKQKKAKFRDVVVEDVHGGRIVRSTGRKDRHSKVCTTRGPRDRRVRLSPNTAIQFYDVQDRLGYDRPSKAIDWLMKEAKSAIDALDDSSYSASAAAAAQLNSTNFLQSAANHHLHHPPAETSFETQEYNMNDISNGNYSFFSMLNGIAVPPLPSSNFNAQPQSNRSQAQGICFSFQDLPFLLGSSGQQVLLPPPIPISQHAETNQRISTWNANNSSNPKAAGEGGSLNPVLPLQHPYQQLPPYQREPLQSSSSPSFQLPNSNYACLRYSNDAGLLELSRLQGEEEQNQIPTRPSIMHFHS